MTLTKADLSEKPTDVIGIPQREAKELIDAFFNEISSCLIGGESVKLAGFGGFDVRNKVSRPGRNPATGEVVMVTARRVVTFHGSRLLKDTVLQQVAR